MLRVTLLHEGIFLLSKDLSDERFSAKLRVTENRCVLFDFNICIYIIFCRI